MCDVWVGERGFDLSEVVVEVVEDSRGFVTLEEEWEDLHRQCPQATPFQSWAWLYSWWEFYGKGYELRLVVIRDGDLLVCLMPLMLERRGGFGRLLFVGTGPTDYQDVLIREGWESQISEVGVRALRQIGSWHVADFQQLRPEAAAWKIFEGWTGPRTRVWKDNFPVIDVRPWDELLASVSKNLRSTARRTLRRIEVDGVRHELVGACDVEEAAHRWIALHREAWRGRAITPEHLSQRFESHLRAAACRMTIRGLGIISEFRRDGEVIASHFLIFGRDFVAEHLPGARQDALRRYQLSTLLIWDAMNIARRRNRLYLDLLRGEEPYKIRWNPRIIPSYRAILGRRLALWGPYAGYHALRSRAKRYSRSEGAPRWIKEATTKYRVLRRVAARYVKLQRNENRRGS
jgi:CelD/BcsL family acetyltransferase involved in cellulose biosynthesis